MSLCNDNFCVADNVEFSSDSPLWKTFEEDIRRHVVADLPHDPAHTGELQAMPMRELLDIYVNWSHRFVPPRPRCIHQSKALQQNPIATDPAHRHALDALIEKIRVGDVLTPHLSDRVLRGCEPAHPAKPKALSKRKDLDLLLNDWLIHHLHIGPTLKSNGFLDGDVLLFAVFKGDDAYLIDLMGHRNWEHEHLIEVIVREWPGRGLAMELNGIFPGQSFSREDRKRLRNVGMPTKLNIDGKVVAGAGCLTTAGTSGYAQQAVLQLRRCLSDFVYRIADNPNYVADILRERGRPVPDRFDLHFEFFRTGGYGIVDSHIGQIIRLG
jgi:hypothetical protein